MTLSAFCAGLLFSAPCPAVITVGIHFVESNEVIDFLPMITEPIVIVHEMEPWNLTDPGNQFVLDGGLVGVTEDQVRQAIYESTVEKYFSIPTPTGQELDLDLAYGEVSGPNAVNTILGKHNYYMAWFGQAVLDGALETPDGGNLAAVSVDRIDSMMPVTFDDFDDVVAGVTNVTAHEIGHLLSLEHVCASEGYGGCEPEDPVVTNPFDIMATGPTGLPDEGWIADNIFTTVLDTQPGGLSSVALLIASVGLRPIGDSDDDGDVDTADVTAAFQNFSGDLGFSGGKSRSQGDFDHDRDVDTGDITLAFQNFTGDQSAQAAFSPDLVYDPDSGNVTLYAEGASLLSFNLQSSGAFVAPADFSDLTDDLPGFGSGLTDNTANAVGWVSPVALANLGFDGSAGTVDTPYADLGNILPLGLDLADLELLLTGNAWSGPGGTGTQFDLVVVPEPTTLLLWLVGCAAVVLWRAGYAPKRGAFDLAGNCADFRQRNMLC